MRKKLMRKKLFIMVLTILLVTFSVSNYVFAARPLSELYTYPGQVSTNINTISSLVGELGYDSHGYNKVSAYYVRRTMNADGIFFIASHGDAVRIYAFDSTGKRTSISGNSVSSDASNYSLQVLFGTNS
jgi:hypothetical protein